MRLRDVHPDAPSAPGCASATSIEPTKHRSAKVTTCLAWLAWPCANCNVVFISYMRFAKLFSYK